MPDHLGSDQRKVKDDKDDEKPIQGKQSTRRAILKSNNFAYSFVFMFRWVG